MLFHIDILLKSPSTRDMPDLVVHSVIVQSDVLDFPSGGNHFDLKTSDVPESNASRGDVTAAHRLSRVFARSAKAEEARTDGMAHPPEHLGVLIDVDAPILRFSITALWDVESAQIGGRKTISHTAQYILTDAFNDGASSSMALWPNGPLLRVLPGLRAPIMDLLAESSARDEMRMSGLRDDCIDEDLVVVSRVETLLMPSIPRQNIENYRCAPPLAYAIDAWHSGQKHPDDAHHQRSRRKIDGAGESANRIFPPSDTDKPIGGIFRSWFSSKDGTRAEATEAIDAPSAQPHIALIDEARFKAFAALGETADRQRRGIIETVTAKIREAGGTFKPLGLLPPDWRAILDEFSVTFPNFQPFADMLARHFAVSAFGDRRIYWSPILLVGPAGIGKTACVRWLAERFAMPYKIFDLASAQTGSPFSGSEAYWTNAEPGDLFRLLAYGRTGNPIAIIDEMDKSATRAQYDPMRPLYALLERGSARHFTDLCVRDFSIDASNINWVATANTLDSIPPPILTRMTVVAIDSPTESQMKSVARSIYRSTLNDESWGSLFDETVSDAVVERLAGMMPREITKAIRLAVGSAALAGRTRIIPDDIPAAANEGKIRIGFAP